MAETEMTVNIRPKFVEIDQEIKELSTKLGTINDIIKTKTESSIGEFFSEQLQAKLKKYEDEIKKAGEDAVEELRKAREEKGEAAPTEEEEEKERKKGEDAKTKEISEDPSKVGFLTAMASKLMPDETDKQMLGLVKDLSKTAKNLGESMMGFTKEVFGFLEDIYKEMRRSSPLLQTIETLFDLAWQLFFMPLGNKLGELMIPAILEMMDAVMGIWDQFDGKDLGEMLSIAVAGGVNILVQYLTTLGTTLSEQSGIVGDIGKLLLWVGNFLDKYGENIANTLFSMLEFFVDHIKEIIWAIYEVFLASIAFDAAYYTASLIAQLGILATLGQFVAEFFNFTGAATAGIAGTSAFMAGAAVFTGVEVAGNASAAYVANDIGMMAEGGYVDAVPGGELITVAEGGEGEWIVPDSKVNNFVNNILNGSPSIMSTTSATRSSVSSNVQSIANAGGQSTINYYINGYTDSELKRIIRETVDEQVSQGRLRSGF